MRSIIDWADAEVLQLIDAYIKYAKELTKPVGVPKTLDELAKLLSAKTGVTIDIGTLKYPVSKRKKELMVCGKDEFISKKPDWSKPEAIQLIDAYIYRNTLSKENRATIPSTKKNLEEALTAIIGPVTRGALDYQLKKRMEEMDNREVATNFNQSIKKRRIVPLFSASSNACASEPDDIEFSTMSTMAPKNASSTENTADNFDWQETETASNDVLELRRKKSTKCDEEKEEVQFERALNNRLVNNQLVVKDGSTHVKIFAINTNNDATGAAYAVCKSCKSTGILYAVEPEVFKVDKHKDSCKSVELTKHISEQEDRKARLLVKNGVPAIDAYAEGFSQANVKNAASNFPQYFEVKAQLSRWAAKGNASCSETLMHGERWLLSKTDECEIYTTDNMARTLAECEVAVADATFGTCPQGWYQVFTIHGLTKSANGGAEYNPLVTALMINKAEETYDQVVNAVLALWSELGVTCNIKRLHTDYESAEINAMKRLVGEDKVYGCLFHYSQAILRSVGKLHLYNHYKMFVGGRYAPEYRPIRTWIRMILALPCLPEEDIELLWNLIKTPPKSSDPSIPWPTEYLLQLAKYVEEQWMQRKDNMVRFFRLGRVRNTNGAESFHSVQAIAFPRKPRKTTFLNRRRKFAEITQVRLEQLKDPKRRVKARNALAKEMETRVEKMETVYLHERNTAKTTQERVILALRFARKASHLLHEISNKSGKTCKSAKTKAAKEALNQSAIWRGDLGLDDDALVKALYQEELSLLENGDVSEEEYDIIAFEVDNEIVGPTEPAEDEKWAEEDLQDDIFTGTEEELEVVYETSKSYPLAVPEEPLECQFVRIVQPFQTPSVKFLQNLAMKNHWKFEQPPLVDAHHADLFNVKPQNLYNPFGDGHCGYRALSYALTGVENNHGVIRHAISTFIKDKKLDNKFYERFPKAKDNAMRRKSAGTAALRDETLWMHMEDLVAASELFKINIVVYKGTHWAVDNVNYFLGKMGQLVEEYPTVFLYNPDNIHFQTVVSFQ